jgi:alpha 1,2-mannosyltransferase
MARFIEQKVADGAFDTVPVAGGGRGLIGKGRGIVFTAGNAVRHSSRLIALPTN